MDFQWPVVRVVGPMILARGMETLLSEKGVPVSGDGAEVLLFLPMFGGEEANNVYQEDKAVRMVGDLAHIENLYGGPPGVQVRGLVSADDTLVCVLEAIKAVASGKAYCSPRLLPQLLDFLQQAAAETQNGSGAKTPEKECLSGREQEVARAAARGLSNEEIARHLHISVATVKFHLSHIFQKLALSRRSQIGAALRQ